MTKNKVLKTNLWALMLLFTLVAPTLSLYSWLRIRKATVKQEVEAFLEEDLPDSELQLLVFAHQEDIPGLRWEHEKEFEYRGQMYDISRSEVVGDSVYYWVWPDHAETALNQAMARVVAGTAGLPDFPGIPAERWADFFKGLFPYFPGGQNFFEPALHAQLISGVLFLPTGVYPGPPAPPPRA